MRYAQNTTVSVDRSAAEILRILQRYGAGQTAWAEDVNLSLASVCFAIGGKQIRLVLRLPKRSDFAVSEKGRRRTEEAETRAWERARRQRWRALALVIKAKLEAVESGISTLEDEFLAWIVLPGNRTVGELIKPQIAEAYLTGKPPAGIMGLLLYEKESFSKKSG